MKIKQVAAQLYTVRDFARTPAEIAQTLKKIRVKPGSKIRLKHLDTEWN